MLLEFEAGVTANPAGADSAAEERRVRRWSGREGGKRRRRGADNAVGRGGRRPAGRRLGHPGGTAAAMRGVAAGRGRTIRTGIGLPAIRGGCLMLSVLTGVLVLAVAGRVLDNTGTGRGVRDEERQGRPEQEQGTDCPKEHGSILSARAEKARWTTDLLGRTSLPAEVRLKRVS